MCMKFRGFSKRDKYPSLIFPEIIDAKKRDYLSLWKVLLQSNIR